MEIDAKFLVTLVFYFYSDGEKGGNDNAMQTFSLLRSLISLCYTAWV